jgi:hypothetical protein
MDIIAAYREAGTYRGAADIAGTTHKTVRRVIARHEAGGAAPQRAARERNYDSVAALVAERVERTAGRISAKRLLPAARAAGFTGSDRNFRRLVAQAKLAWRRDHHRGRRPAVWSPAEHLVIDWGALGGLHVFCAVLAWSRFRFVRFAADERAETTLWFAPGSLEASMSANCLLAYRIPVLDNRFPRTFSGEYRRCMSGSGLRYTTAPSPSSQASRHRPRSSLSSGR